ncbi:MAG: twin-arginine translocation signal domain-containing protein [Chloroflexota bacterium]
MAKLTRRHLLYQSSMGAAAVGILPVASRLAVVAPPPAAVPEAVAEAEVPATTLAAPLVAYLHTAAPGELTLLMGTREIVVRDAALIARLIKAAL